MKIEIARYVARCDTCRRVKAIYMKTAGPLQSLPIPAWKWEDISMDFIVGLPRTTQGYDSIWVKLHNCHPTDSDSTVSSEKASCTHRTLCVLLVCKNED